MSRLLLARIAAEGPLPFPAFMESALYHPDHGYYSDPKRKIGRHGDFFTSVSVGPVFGAILARRALACWTGLGRPDRWRLAEVGAHDGTLARDLAGELHSLDPAATAGLVFSVPEPIAARRDLLADSLAGLPVGAVEILDPADAPPAPLPGMIVANEVLDALPCHLVEFDGSAWRELVVDQADERLVLRPREPAGPRLAAALQALGREFPAGYRTELRTGLDDFLRPLRDLLQRGTLLFFDYGFAGPDFYHPDRREGTLRTYSGHHAGDDPLDSPGNRDLSAHVDFTAVADAAGSLGLTVARFQDQGGFLTETGRQWIESLADLPADQRAGAVRQFQTLTHPAHLGSRFHALELAWRMPLDAAASKTARGRLRLG